MELDQFVAKSLVMICKGVHQAQQEVMEFGASINEKPMAGGESSKYLKAQNSTLMQTVEFDVAVVTEDNGSGSAKISVLGLGLSKGGDTKDSITSRIAFKVPISLPRNSK
ncbi:hypothetical protein QRC92_004726 [Vibrio parahaemolyticus]|uniref:hypothetical protein n=1 Tax=Vibrio parahaemolyticus TaxID=670 RepID=UPI0005B72177|nr:hypothetical protein [Vibrio parahaemolyticus]KIT28495.1 hypothetical protein H323_23105 [Vibrio parahaemolyticus VP766]EGR2774388.1 hypothetical protein [Vibrio parahaemolyticus]EGR2836872.1 hypothetical protein [Vibrio parahaemolyticus]EGR2890234.1 hypothetical protein [Vibrio parahaemolyticus]EGR2909589.1 hypothetical protein [Vibrio parahaemolyticus]